MAAAVRAGASAALDLRPFGCSVDSDAASPRVSVQFSEYLAGRRTKCSPRIAVAGFNRPAHSYSASDIWDHGNHDGCDEQRKIRLVY
jgi:hypothetical protein